MKQLWERVKFYAGVWFAALILGFFMGKFYAYDAVITDCKVLGMTRFGDVPMGCRVGEKYQ